MKKNLFLAATAMSLLLSCGGPKGEDPSSSEPSSGEPLSSVPEPSSEATPSSLTPSSEPPSSESVPAEPSSSEPAPLAEGYFYDAEGHWKQREGDPSHERINYAPHSLSEWEEDGDGLSRSCEVCGYSEHHSHEFGGYSYDDASHWKEATCGHEAESERAPHSLERTYHLEGESLVRVDSCGVCGYAHEEAISNEAGLAESIAYSTLGDGTTSIAGLGDHWGDDVLIYPSSIDGKTVSTIQISGPWGDYDDSSMMTFATVYIPSSIKTLKSVLLNRPNLDVVYDGNLSDWLSLTRTSTLCDCRANLYLKDSSGFFRLLHDVTLPAGTKTLEGLAFHNLTIASLTCNEDLESIRGMPMMACHFLRKAKLNDGLKNLSLSAFQNSGLTEFEFPGSLESISGSLSCPRLREITIPSSLKASLSASAFYSCPRLLAIYDHRTTGRVTFQTSRPLLVDETTGKLRTIFDQGYVLVEAKGKHYLIDYEGADTSPVLPDSFVDADDAIDSYILLKGFFYVNGLSGSSPISHEIYSWIVGSPALFGVTIPASVSDIEEGAMGKEGNNLENIYFRMPKEEVDKRLHEDYSTDRYPPSIYYLEGESYVPYPIISKQD